MVQGQEMVKISPLPAMQHVIPSFQAARSCLLAVVHSSAWMRGGSPSANFQEACPLLTAAVAVPF